MLEKRRYGAAGVPTSPLVAAVLTATVCLSLWGLSSCPGNNLPLTHHQLVAPSYLLLLPGNASSLPPPYPVHKLPSWDRNTLIDVKDFEFRLNNFPCNDTTSLLLLVLVHSAPGNLEKRRTIRETWGGRLPSTDSHRVLFLLGEVDTQEEQAALEEENRIHRDLVQGSFRDSYRNMTYKHVMALKWTTYYCPGARYLLKTDDDVFVNSPALLDFLAQDLSPWGARRLILCAPFPFAYVKRSYRSKWRVSPKEYPGRTYPAYCAGWAVLYSPDVVFLLYREAQRGEYFWIDDVHVTGTLAARVNLTQTPLGQLVLSPEQVATLISTSSTRSSSSTSTSASQSSKDSTGASESRVFLFGSPNLSLSEIHQLWQLVQDRKTGRVS